MAVHKGKRVLGSLTNHGEARATSTVLSPFSFFFGTMCPYKYEYWVESRISQVSRHTSARQHIIYHIPLLKRKKSASKGKADRLTAWKLSLPP